uniref:Uncharacterized protein n=1 Tax=Eutreptiella gymnastica TaxID=73025 RepID=A0A7S4GAE8_9EUGL|mmetsp:Transcript_78753/g.131499  ORF Transcript_78753/g.131499 Transcript_78753/m.131499 type:complete len:178 (+) Transcript_78753:703-1236(+)
MNWGVLQWIQARALHGAIQASLHPLPLPMCVVPMANVCLRMSLPLTAGAHRMLWMTPGVHRPPPHPADRDTLLINEPTHRPETSVQPSYSPARARFATDLPLGKADANAANRAGLPFPLPHPHAKHRDTQTHLVIKSCVVGTGTMSPQKTGPTPTITTTQSPHHRHHWPSGETLILS